MNAKEWGMTAGGIAMAGIALYGIFGLKAKPYDGPTTPVLENYTRQGSSINISFQRCTQNYGGCPAYDFTENDRSQIATMLDAIPTDILEKSGVRRLIPIPAGPSQVVDLSPSDAILVYVAAPFDRAPIRITNDMMNQIVQIIMQRAQNSQTAVINPTPPSHVGTADAGIAGPKNHALVVSPNVDPMAFTPVLTNGALSRTGQRLNDTHDVSAVSKKGTTSY